MADEPSARQLPTIAPPPTADRLSRRRSWGWPGAVAASVVSFAAAYCLVTPRAAPPTDSLQKAIERATPSAEPERRVAVTAIPPSQVPRTESQQPSESLLTPDAIFARCSPAVVQLVVKDGQGRSYGDGSGFVVSAEGLIATNYHVIKDAHTAIVVLANGTELPVEGAAALDQDADLAIIKVGGRVTAQPLELARSELPPVGVKVYAIGNPHGLTQSLSDGLVSGHRARGTIPDFPHPRAPTLIQTTAPISPGSSGGPLLGADGKVVGVTTWGASRGQNLNLAVPASHVARLVFAFDADRPLTQFPLAKEPATERRKTALAWSPEEFENAAHFVRALQVRDDAWAICRRAEQRPWQPGDPPVIVGAGGKAPSKIGRPWLLNASDLREFKQLMRQAASEARLVRKDVLARMHPQLAFAFDDFTLSANYLAANAAVSRPDTRYTTMSYRWSEWWMTNRADVRIPAESKEAAAPNGSFLSIAINASKPLGMTTTRPIRSVVIREDSVARAQPLPDDPTRVLVVGRQAGSTHATLTDDQGVVEVVRVRVE